MNFAPVASHTLRAGTKNATAFGRASVAGQDGQSFDRGGTWRRKLHVVGLEDLELVYAGEQALPFSAVDFMAEQVAAQRALLDGIVALSADHHPVSSIVL